MPRKNNDQRLFEASRDGDLELVQQLLKKGADPNSHRVKSVDSALHVAKTAAIAEALIHAGAIVDYDNGAGTPLHKASKDGRSELVKVLVEAGADEDHYSCDIPWPTPLLCAKNVEVANVLLEFGADIELCPDHYEFMTDQDKFITPLRRALGRGDDIELCPDHYEFMTEQHKCMTPLRKAVKAGNLEMVKLLLERGAKTSWPCSSALHEAEDIAVVKALVTHAADIEHKVGNLTPLFIQVTQGKTQIVQYLLDHGANANTTNIHGETPLHHSVSDIGLVDETKLLLKAGADVNLTCNHGQTALYNALEIGNIKAAKILLDHGANADIPRGYLKITLLQKAAFHGQNDVVKILLDGGASVDLADQEGVAPLHLAAWNNDVVKTLLDGGASVDLADQKGKTTLHRAAQTSPNNVVKTLLDGGASVDLADQKGDTPLHRATLTGHNDVVKTLLNGGASVDLENHEGETPLHRAVWRRNIDVVKTLLDGGARVDLADLKGDTPLHTAIAAKRSAMVELLLDHGADVNAADKAGRTPLHWAAGWTHTTKVASILLDRGANIQAIDNDGRTPLHLCFPFQFDSTTMIQFLLDKDETLVNVGDNNGETPMHRASAYGYPEIVRVLLERGAHVNEMDNKNQTPLHKAAQFMGGWVESHPWDSGRSLQVPYFCQPKGNAAVLKLLLENGSDVAKPDIQNLTPMFFAAYRGKKDTVRLLLQSGAMASDVCNQDTNSPVSGGNKRPAPDGSMISVKKKSKHN